MAAYFIVLRATYIIKKDSMLAIWSLFREMSYQANPNEWQVLDLGFSKCKARIIV